MYNTYGGVIIEVRPLPTQESPPLLYSDIVNVLRGISHVENELGFSTRFMTIYHEQKGHLGDALIGWAFEAGGYNATGTSLRDALESNPNSSTN